jgi:hypothetical protein
LLTTATLGVFVIAVKVHLKGYEIISEAGPNGEAPGSFSFITDNHGTFSFYVIASDETSAANPSPREYYLGSLEVK